MKESEQNVLSLTPEDFELGVKEILEASGAQLQSFVAQHREKIKAADGTYEIDITARFKALGVDFLVLAECKYQKNPIKRDVIQVLNDRIRATGAHKGVVFATTNFQKGAVEYAKKHGIALVRVAKGQLYTTIAVQLMEPLLPPGPCEVVRLNSYYYGEHENHIIDQFGFPRFRPDELILVGWLVSDKSSESSLYIASVVTKRDAEPLVRYLSIV